MGDESFTPLDKLMSLGKDMGYTGEDLRHFVENQQKLERDERAGKRRLESERKETARKQAESEGRCYEVGTGDTSTWPQ